MTHRPDLYDAWFAFSPSYWVGAGSIVGRLETFLDANPDLDALHYATLGSEEGSEMEVSFYSVRDVLERKAPERLRWTATVVPGANHGTNPDLSISAALADFWSVRGGA